MVAVYFWELHRRRRPEKNPDQEIPADEKVLVDLWHWKDDYVQPIQRIRAEVERKQVVSRDLPG